MSVKKPVNKEGRIPKSPGLQQIKTLIDTALGNTKADTGVQEAREQVRAPGLHLPHQTNHLQSST